MNPSTIKPRDQREGSPRGFLWHLVIGMVLALFSTGAGVLIADLGTEPARLPPLIKLSSTLSLPEFRGFAEAKGGLILDVRSDVLYRQGHVPGALSLPAARFPVAYLKLKSRLEASYNQPLVLYCESNQCDLSDQVRAWLVAKGFTQVAIFPAGWLAWQSTGLPQEKSSFTAKLEPWKGAK